MHLMPELVVQDVAYKMVLMNIQDLIDSYP